MRHFMPDSLPHDRTHRVFNDNSLFFRNMQRFVLYRQLKECDRVGQCGTNAVVAAARSCGNAFVISQERFVGPQAFQRAGGRSAARPRRGGRNP